MIRKIALVLGIGALLVLMALNAYLAMNRLSQIQKSAALTLLSSTIQANISAVLQDLTDMESSSAWIPANRELRLLASLHGRKKPDRN